MEKTEYIECEICKGINKKTPELIIGKLKTKEDFEKIFDISLDPWNQNKLNKWELKSISIINNIINNLNKKRNLNILDIGCATGKKDFEILKNFSKSNDIYFVDISKRAIKIAKKNIKNGTFIEADINKGLKFKDKFFDIIFLLETIYYLDIDRVTKELNRLINDNGTIIMDITLNDENYSYNDKELIEKLNKLKIKVNSIDYVICKKCDRKRGIFVFNK